MGSIGDGGSSRFLDLPSEILLQLLDIKSGLSMADLAALCLTSKKLNVMVTPCLYREVVLDASEDDYHYLFPFFATMLTHPRLAKLVQSLEWNLMSAEYGDDPDWDVMPRWFGEDFPEDTQEKAKDSQEDDEDRHIPRRVTWQMAKHIQAFLDACGTDYPSPYILSEMVFDLQTKGAVLGFLVAHLPNLRALVIKENDYDLWRYVDEMMKLCLAAPSDSQLGFRNIEYMHIDATADGERDCMSEYVTYFTKLPALKHLRCYHVSDSENYSRNIMEEDDLFGDLQPRKSNVSRLDLRNESQLTSDNLKMLLGTFKALEHFEMDCINVWSWKPFSAVAVQQGLSLHRDSLRHVSLCVTFEIQEDAEVEPMNFSSFHHLETLDIDLVFAFGLAMLGPMDPESSKDTADLSPTDLVTARKRLCEMLPRSIRKLRFSDCDYIRGAKLLDAAILKLLESRTEAHPALASIDFSNSVPSEIQSRIELRQFMEHIRPAVMAARSSGIEVPVVQSIEGDEIKLNRDDFDERLKDYTYDEGILYFLKHKD